MSSSNTVSKPPIKLRRMPQQSAVYDPDEDWTGVTSSALRRRIQNRLNQRAYRARRVERAQIGKQMNNSPQRHGTEDTTTSTLIHNHPSSQTTAIICTLSDAQHVHCTFAPPNVHSLMTDLEKRALEGYLSGSPKTDLLISLSRLNVLKAAYENVLAMGMTAEWLCGDEITSIFSLQGPQFSEDKIPISLRPTALQRSTPHHPWLDVFPFPRMRDNLIRAGDHLNDDELCHDLTAFWDTRTSHARLLVWGTPSCPENWEVTEDFAKKWGFFLQGCPAILASTNAWRVRRGERPLVWKRIFGIF
ncbi:uncharacterized protein N7484_000955 [Penicillium longicatenatum]|uniref:uncharacterized protein n=1 Tax=Penicillium longicatenatum TaxID=1561947 RepID=UPI00254773FD|nr:uncharacterized protein N7484_000955 [Penicillium longicatenatum]KAJ5657306.1 hypothetical protein N7484_000955 [Penicillium longicatenatum]